MRGEVISKKMTSKQQKITDDLDAMFSILPPDIAQSVQSEDNFDNLLEIILDLAGSQQRALSIVKWFYSLGM